MDYHPIMGISIFALSVGGAYLVGRRWAARRAAAKRPAAEPGEEIRTGGKRTDSEGDALAPDAPWVERGKKLRSVS